MPRPRLAMLAGWPACGHNFPIMHLRQSSLRILHCSVLLLLGTCSACTGSAAARSEPAEMNPQSLPDLNSLDELPAEGAVQRSGSFLNRVLLSGDEFSEGTIAHSGTGLASLSSEAQGPGPAQWLIYRFAMQGVDAERVAINWDGTDIPEYSSGFHIMLADYGSGRWRYINSVTQPDPVISLPAVPALSPFGNTFLAIICYGGQAASINSIAVWSDSEHSVPQPQPAAALHVGPGQAYADIESAYADVNDNGAIIVHPQPGNAPYMQPHLQVYKAGIAFLADNTTLPAGSRVRLQGGAYNYTGAGPVPRAVFQFNPGADGGLVQGFEIFDAHNDSHNGAALRINQANDLSIVDCEIHGCDMGIMSNGSAADVTAARQLILSCVIHGNGNLSDPGYNHNLYLGGHSVTLRHCEVYGALTGHNVKSRAHINRLEYCYIHDSANREIDFVDAADTELPGSDSMLLGCIVVKQQNMDGNKHTIHFGQDGGHDHDGTLFLTQCTIVTPYLSPVVQLTAASAGLRCVNSLFWSTENPTSGQSLVSVANGTTFDNVSGDHNWFSESISYPTEPGLDPDSSTQGLAGEHPPFADPGSNDFHLTGLHMGITDSGRPLDWQLDLQYSADYPNILHTLDEYRATACAALRPVVGLPDIGAYEFVP